MTAFRLFAPLPSSDDPIKPEADEENQKGKKYDVGHADLYSTVWRAFRRSMMRRDIRFIQALLGHESLNTRIYTHVNIAPLVAVHAATPYPSLHPRRSAAFTRARALSSATGLTARSETRRAALAFFGVACRRSTPSHAACVSARSLANALIWHGVAPAIGGSQRSTAPSQGDGEVFVADFLADTR